jgi:hypothetical protein
MVCKHDGCDLETEPGSDACESCNGFAEALELDGAADIQSDEVRAQAIARYHTASQTVHSPAKYVPAEHGADLAAFVRHVAADDYPEKSLDELCGGDLIDVVVRCHEISTARRVHASIKTGIGLQSFVSDGDRLPIKRDLRESIEQAFLLIADALVAVNRGDLEYLELGQSERAEVTRTRQLRDEISSGAVDMSEAMSRLAECFGDRLPEGEAAETHGLRPWNPDRLSCWSTCYASSTQKLIACFLLNLWNDSSGAGDYGWPRFEFFDAMRKLDGRSLNVIRAWMCSHWLP